MLISRPTHAISTALLYQIVSLLLLLGVAGNGICSGQKFKIGFSSNTLGEVNENDAMAAVQLWTQGLATDNSIPVDPEPIIYPSLDEINTALRTKQIDCVNVTLPEFFHMQDNIDKDTLIAGMKQGSIYEEYVIIVNKHSGFKSIRDLRNKSLIQLDTSRTPLAPSWLSVELRKQKLPSMNAFFSSIVISHSLTATVLPVFFGKADACLVTLSGYETMAELNPQLHQQLVLLEKSEPYIPMLFAFRKTYASPQKMHILEQVRNWHNSPGGRQILTIFQTDSIVRLSFTKLEESLKLVEQSEISQ